MFYQLPVVALYLLLNVHHLVELVSKLWEVSLIKGQLSMSSEVRVEGLETLDYFDNLKSRERFTEQGDAITFESEVSSS